ncbi:uncharacterized protein [Ambystoma mexicanum]|uniref:uncharacterized protein n=1 Tax=Ambystoma mexicanum TaxID=8296 RepID=UPI0037E947DF
MSFVPTTIAQDFDTQVELHKFFRLIRLKYFFKDGLTSTKAPSITGLKAPSHFTPSNAMVRPAILAFENKILEKTKHLLKDKNHHRDNLSNSERLALDALQKNTMFLIKPADKGGGIVLWDTTLYSTEVMLQLNNPVFYRRLNHDPTASIGEEIKSLMDHALHEEWIDQDEHQFLIKTSPVTPAFYLLPKVHKNECVPPGRPIVSAINSILEPLSIYADWFLRPFVLHMNSYVKDTTSMINLVSEIYLNTTDLLVTLDVTSLYTSIPQGECLKIMEMFLNRRTDTLLKVPTPFIMECIRIALTENFFLYEGTFYKQIHGTSMGATFAPDLANLFMDHFENTSIYHPSNPFNKDILKWCRYIDDVFMIWQGDLPRLHVFLEWLNNHNPYIKFTMTSNSTTIPFLDLLISKTEEGTLSTTLFRKPTDKNTLLIYNSFHPRSLRENLPIGQFLRLRRNCTDLEDFTRASRALKQRLSARGYPQKCINRAYKRAKYANRARCLQHEPSIKEDRITCVSTFSPISNALRKVIKQQWHILTTEDFSPKQPRFAFKRQKNVRDWLVHTYPAIRPFSSQSTLWNLPPVVGHFKCGHCSVCDLTDNYKSIDLNGKVWNLRSFSNCASEWLIYGIKCPCNLLYIGKTSRTVRLRICEHRSCLKNKTENKPLVSHFITAKHHYTDFKWFVIQKISPLPRGGNRDLSLSRAEQRLIYTLNTVNRGLNSSVEWNNLIT